MIPVVGVMAASGILKGLLALLTQFNVVAGDSDTYRLISAMSDSMFFFLPMIMVKHYRTKRIKKFNTQLVDALQAMANAFKAGLTFQQSIEQVSKDAMPPLQQEFGLFVKEAKLGVLAGSLLSALAGYAVLRWARPAR